MGFLSSLGKDLLLKHLIGLTFKLASFKLASFKLASFQLASFQLASFQLASFQLASFIQLFVELVEILSVLEQTTFDKAILYQNVQGIVWCSILIRTI